MLTALIALEIVTLLAVIALLLRKRPETPEATPEAREDPRLAQLLAADLPGQFTRLDARSQALEQHLRGELAQLRADATGSSAALRGEVLNNISTLSKALHTSLEAARGDSARQAAQNREAVHTDREALHARLGELRSGQTEHLDKLRDTVERRLDALNLTNEAKLEQMRQTVDEKLHATLQNRLTESFGQVTDQLTKVHAGLGEMTKLSAGVDDLSRIFTNVKSRGGFAEVQLGMLLQQMLAPSQFLQNVKVKPNTQELVEYAVKFPTPTGETLLPIDAKFPREAWERLETAYETGTDIVSAGKAFETAIRIEGKRICEKYIAPPATTSFAIMFLPTEGLYAEVMRRDGLQSDIQQNCRVTIAGPSTLSAILNSFQMGFHMLQMQQKGDEVWKVLAGAKKEFGNLGVLMTKMEKQVDTVQNTIQDVGRRTRAIDKRLGDVGVDSSETALPTGTQSAFDGLLPMLSASEVE
jgi:DNA recombination protein RmuC